MHSSELSPYHPVGSGQGAWGWVVNKTDAGHCPCPGNLVHGQQTFTDTLEILFNYNHAKAYGREHGEPQQGELTWSWWPRRAGEKESNEEEELAKVGRAEGSAYFWMEVFMYYVSIYVEKTSGSADTLHLGRVMDFRVNSRDSVTCICE